MVVWVLTGLIFKHDGIGRITDRALIDPVAYSRAGDCIKEVDRAVKLFQAEGYDDCRLRCYEVKVDVNVGKAKK